jgi:hypothetical protein
LRCIGGQPRDELAGAGGIVKDRRQPQQVGEDIVAQIANYPLAQA